MRSLAFDFIDSISSAKTQSELHLLLNEMSSAYGLANLAYVVAYLPAKAHGISPYPHDAFEDYPLVFSTYHENWLRRYAELEYRMVDPVISAVKTALLPVDWCRLDRESQTVRPFFKDAARHGIGHQGLTFSIRGPGGERALFSATAHLSDREWEPFKFVCIHELQFIANHFHDRVMQLSGYRTLAGHNRLSPREKEAMSFLAGGLEPKQIAGLLEISDRAVRMYIQNACNKLGCANSHQAIAKLVALELIRP